MDIIKKIVPAVIIALLIIPMVFFAKSTYVNRQYLRDGVYYDKAVVKEIISEDLSSDNISGLKAGTQQVIIEMTAGPNKGEVFSLTNQASYTYNVICEVGTKLIVSISEYDGVKIATVFTYDRSDVLIITFIVFAATLIIIGGVKGFKSLIGLIFTLCCIILLFIPAIYRGVSPIPASIVLVVISTFATMILIDGWNSKTISAILGTVICVSVSGILSAIVGHFANISAFTMAETDSIVTIARTNNIKPGGILFASILIASMGAIMDVAMSISSSLHEVYINNRSLNRKQLIRSGINIGRDMMGTMSNTLVLAFTGSFLTTILVLFSYDITLNEIFSMPSIVEEIVKGLTGSIGIFISVPVVSIITTWMIGYQSSKNN